MKIIFLVVALTINLLSESFTSIEKNTNDNMSRKNSYVTSKYYYKEEYKKAFEYAQKTFTDLTEEIHRNEGGKTLLLLIEDYAVGRKKILKNNASSLNDISVILSTYYAYKNALATPEKESIKVMQIALTQWLQYKGYIFEVEENFKTLDKSQVYYQDISKHLTKNQLYVDIVSGSQNFYLFTLDRNNHITFQKISHNETVGVHYFIKKFGTINKKLVQAISNKTITLQLEEKLKKESQEILSELYTILIKPLSKKLKNKKSLIISPDGLLNFLPFEAIYHNGKYLIEDYDISYISSGREFIRQTHREKAHPKYKMICFGDPDFNTTTIASTKRIKGMFGNQVIQQHFEKIGKDEINTIRSIYGDNARIFEDKEASIENLMRVESSEILHFSTHGMKTGLAFAGVNNRENLNGIVTPLKVSELNLKDTNLVVLSACESGLGEIQNSEGVIGLPKAFLQAGAREVIMSLWSVSTQKTAELMEKFYKNVQNGDEYATALRRAKIKMLKKHPYYWSAFVMHGVPNLTQGKK